MCLLIISLLCIVYFISLIIHKQKKIWQLNQALVSHDWVLGLVLTSFQSSFIPDSLESWFFAFTWLFLVSTHLHQNLFFLVIISGDIETGRLWNETSLRRYNKKSQQNLDGMNYSAMEIWWYFFFFFGFNFHMAWKPSCTVTGAERSPMFKIKIWCPFR